MNVPKSTVYLPLIEDNPRHVQILVDIASGFLAEGRDVYLDVLSPLIREDIYPFRARSLKSKLIDLLLKPFGLPGMWRYIDEIRTLEENASRMLGNLAVRYPAPHGKKMSTHVGVCFQSLEQIENLEDRTFRYGTAILSNIYTEWGGTTVPKRFLYRRARELYAVYWRIEALVEEVFRNEHVDQAVIYNGRFVQAASVEGVARRAGVEVWFHEEAVAPSPGYFLESWRPQDFRRRGREALEWWARKESKSKELWQRDFESSRAVYLSELRSVRNSINHELQPVSADASQCRNIVFFLSSEDEFAAIPDVTRESIFRGQVDAIEWLSGFCRERAWNLTVKLHPGIGSRPILQRLFWRFWLKLRFFSVDWIDSRSRDSIPWLLSSSSLNVFWGSSLIADSVRLGKPTCVLTETVFEEAGGEIFRPGSLEDLESFLDQPTLPRTNPDSMLPLHAYMLSRSNGANLQGLRHRKFSIPKLVRGLRSVQSISSQCRLSGSE